MSSNKEQQQAAPSTPQIQQQVPPNFEQVVFVEHCLEKVKTATSLEVIQFLASELALTDYVVNLRHSVLLDFFVYNLEFAKNHSYHAEKASAFLSIMENTRKIITRPEQDAVQLLPEAKLFFKQQVLANTLIRKKMPEPIAVASPVITEQVTDDKKKKPDAKPKKKTKEQEEAELKAKQQAEEEAKRQLEPIILPPLFNSDDVQEITQYAADMLFQHYRLYHFVFTKEQEQQVFEFNELVLAPASSTIPFIQFSDGATFAAKKEKARLEKEQLERQEMEAEIERLKREAEEERLYLERLREEKKAPKLSKEDLEELAEFLKFHVGKNVDEQREALVQKITDLQSKLQPIPEESKSPAANATTNTKKPAPAKK